MSVSGTAAAPAPWLDITPALMGKAALSTALLACGMYYLARGRREADMNRIITGAILTLLSIALF